MPVVRRRGQQRRRQGSNGRSILSILSTSIVDGSSEYNVSVVTKNDSGLVRIRIKDNGDVIAEMYMDPEKAMEFAMSIAHMAFMARNANVTTMLWRMYYNRNNVNARQNVEENEENVEEQSNEEEGNAESIFEDIST